VSGDDAVMKRLNVAWDVLRDPERRAAYDQERVAAAPEGSIIYSRPGPPSKAGPPPGNGFGRVLTFSRYEGWSLGEVAAFDPGYLQWLRDSPPGRRLRDEIDAVFAELAERPHTLGGRRPGFGARGAGIPTSR
jgi:curved DNA-binding protein CbpA